MSDYQRFIAWLEKTYPTHARAYSSDPVIQSAFFAGMVEGQKVCTSDEWLANATQSTRDLANKIKSQQLRGTGNQFRNETDEEVLQREVDRLITELKKANAQTEEFERKWYLCCDIIETLNGERTVMVDLIIEALRVIETIESDDSDEEAELTRLKGHMGKLINQFLTSLMGKP